MKFSISSVKRSILGMLAIGFVASLSLTSCHSSHLCPAYPYKSKKGVENIAHAPAEKQANG